MDYRLIDKSGNYPTAGNVPMTLKEVRAAALRIGKGWMRKGVPVDIEIHHPSGRIEYIDDMWCTPVRLTREQKQLLRRCGVHV